MSIWGKIIGGTTGFALGGPLGAIIGIMIGGSFDRSARKFSSSNQISQQQKQNVFALCIIVLSAKIAKADGQVTKEEIYTFKEKFNIQSEEMSEVSKIFNEAKKSSFGFKNIADQVGNLFSDNIFFKGDKLSGIIDYYFSCYDFYAFEIAICLNALCFEGKNENLSFNVTKSKKFIDGYSSIRKLNEEEKKSLKILCQGAAIRFLLTRVFDYLNLIEGAIVKIKDPLEYLKRLEFHNNVKNYQDYSNN